MFNFYMPNHMYTVAVCGAKVKSKTFSSRAEANSYMYKMVDKLGLGHVQKVYDDHHEKTYIYEGDVRFFINRTF